MMLNINLIYFCIEFEISHVCNNTGMCYGLILASGFQTRSIFLN